MKASDLGTCEARGIRIVIRRQMVLLAGLCGMAACTDRTGPTAPAPPSSSRVISCQADVRARILACGAPSLSASSGITGDLVLGGQGAYVALRSTNVSYNGGTTTFQADVTVENLTAQPLGTPDGGTVTGVKVFFSSGPTVTSGTGTVTVANPDGTGTFTQAAQPYFLYNQMLATAQVSAARTWQWSVPTTVNRFAFQVLVDAASPHEHTVLRWLYDPIGDGAGIAAVWSASATSVFAVGDGGKILHYDAASWTAQASPIPVPLTGVWGSSGTNVWTVGLGGTLLRYDGISWTAPPSPTGVDLFAVWGSSASDVFAVGDAGTILHYDGTSWTVQTTGTAQGFLGVWGASASDVFAVGDSGLVFHYNGSAWSAQAKGSHTNGRVRECVGELGQRRVHGG